MLRERPYHASSSTHGMPRLKLQRQMFLWPPSLLIVPEVYEERQHWSKLRSVPVPRRGFSHRPSIATKEDAFTPHDGIVKRLKDIPSRQGARIKGGHVTLAPAHGNPVLIGVYVFDFPCPVAFAYPPSFNLSPLAHYPPTPHPRAF